MPLRFRVTPLLVVLSAILPLGAPAVAAETVPISVDSVSRVAVDGLSSLPQAERQRQQEQAPLMELANDVAADIADRDQFLGAELDRMNMTLKIHWHGPVPAALAKKASGSVGRLRIVPAKHSAAEMRNAISRLVDELRLIGMTRIRVEQNLEASSLDVQVSHLPGQVSSGSARSASDRVSAVLQSVADRTGITISTQQVAADVVPTNRYYDASPFYGGASVRNDLSSNNYCTAGWPMHATGDPNAHYLLYAAHCAAFQDGKTVYVPTNQGTAIGRSDFIQYLFWNGPYHYDLAVVRLSAGLTGGTRLWTTPASTSFPIGGYGQLGLIYNAEYCNSPSQITPTCGVYPRTQTTVYDPGVWGPNPVTFIKVTGPNASALSTITPSRPLGSLWCQGDSGGPIHYWGVDGRAYAGGIMSGAYANSLTETRGAWWNPSVKVQCFGTGLASVVATAVQLINGLAINHT